MKDVSDARGRRQRQYCEASGRRGCSQPRSSSRAGTGVDGLRVRTRVWSHRIKAGIAGVFAIGLLGTVAMPTAAAENDQLAGWLTRTFEPVQAIHGAEGAVSDALDGGLDATKMQAACGKLDDARKSLQAQMPSPDSALNLEVQQAIDKFESAVESCTKALETKGKEQESNLVKMFMNLDVGEQHLVSADIVLAGLAAKG
jgi:hypothetical protein